MFSDACKHVSCLLKTRFALAENAFSDACKKAENAFSDACKCVSRLLKSGRRKSLCFCLLPKAFDALRGTRSVDRQSIVIFSLLIALLKDQVRQMTERRECVVCCRG